MPAARSQRTRHVKGRQPPPLQTHNLLGLTSVTGEKTSQVRIRLHILTGEYYNEKQSITLSVVFGFWTILGLHPQGQIQ